MPLDLDLSREESWMRKSALHYLGQRATSTANLRLVLRRRARRRLGAGVDAGAMIERTITHCVRLGFLDDAAFVEARIHAGRNKGLSTRRIGATLKAKGVDAAFVAEALAAEDRQGVEEKAAARFAQRKRIGPWREASPDRDINREIAMLARGGFAISLARRILTGPRDEIEALLEI